MVVGDAIKMRAEGLKCTDVRGIKGPTPLLLLPHFDVLSIICILVFIELVANSWIYGSIRIITMKNSTLVDQIRLQPLIKT